MKIAINFEGRLYVGEVLVEELANGTALIEGYKIPFHREISEEEKEDDESSPWDDFSFVGWDWEDESDSGT